MIQTNVLHRPSSNGRSEVAQQVKHQYDGKREAKQPEQHCAHGVYPSVDSLSV